MKQGVEFYVCIHQFVEVVPASAAWEDLKRRVRERMPEFGVEMPKDVIKNYSLQIKKCMHSASKIALSSYGEFNTSTTLDLKILKEYFDFDFDLVYHPSMVPNKKNIFLINK